MKAVWYDQQGDAAEVLCFGELPTPQPVHGELRVRLHASAVNPADAKRRAGQGHPMEFPRIIPNSDGAGVVDAVGPGVDTAWIGERVWLHFAQRGRAFGTAAEYVCVAEELASRLPTHVTLTEGACLGIPCMTAWSALFGDSRTVGERVLVTGGAGAVGHYAVQLAKAAGAHVVATVSTDRKGAHARKAGADVVVDYKLGNIADAILNATDGYGVDRIIDVDAAVNSDHVMQCARSGATWVAYAVATEPCLGISMTPIIRKNVLLRGLYLPGLPHSARRLAKHGVERWLRDTPGAIHTVDSVYPLDEMATAHRAVEDGAKMGAVVAHCD